MPSPTPQHDRESHDATLLAYLRSLTVEERLQLNDAAIKVIRDLRTSGSPASDERKP